MYKDHSIYSPFIVAQGNLSSLFILYLYAETDHYSWKPFFPCLSFRKNKEDFLRNLARDNVQLLFNAIWKVRLMIHALLIIIFLYYRDLLVSVFSLVLSTKPLILNCIIIF